MVAMKREGTMKLVGGMGLGAALMYLLDPDKGRRRRALTRDKAVSLANKSGKAVEPTLEDLGNRATGKLHEARQRLFSKEVGDEVLVRRVRSELGRHVSHPRSVSVTASSGMVTLHGPILEHEVDGMMRAIRRVPGVQRLDNQMSVHKTAGNVPGLQGGDVPAARRTDQWSPSGRLAMGTMGSALTALGARTGGVLGTALGVTGITALLRAISNKELKRMVGIDSGRRAVDIQKTINVDASPEEVYEYWSNFENFPKFMAHLRKVEDKGDGRSHWVAAGPAGTEFSWDAVVTERVPGRMIAWRSLPGAQVQNAGMVHFSPNRRGGTQIQVHMSYNPPAGAVGHVIADILGRDPRSAMHDDLARFKTLMEQGKTTARGETVTREQVRQTS